MTQYLKKNSKNTSFIHSLEIFKSLAFATMIVLHSLVWWISKGSDGQVQGLEEVKAIVLYLVLIVGVSTLSFGFAAGSSLFFWTKEQRTKSHFSRAICVRVFILMAVGFFLNPEGWYIFQFLGLSTALCSAIFLGFGPVGVILSGLSVVLFYPWIGALNWETLGLSKGSLWVGIITGGTGERYFWPLFPWFSLFCLGFLLAERFDSTRVVKKTFFRGILFVALLLINLTYFSGKMLPETGPQLWGPAIFEPGLVMFLQWVGVILFSFFVIHSTVETRYHKLLSWLAPVSRHSLILYIIHYRFFGALAFKMRSDSLIDLIAFILLQFLIIFGLGRVLDRLIRFSRILYGS